MIGKTILHYKILDHIEKDPHYAEFLKNLKSQLWKDENENSVRSEIFIEQIKTKPNQLHRSGMSLLRSLFCGCMAFCYIHFMPPGL
jgi:hypothetical protein